LQPAAGIAAGAGLLAEEACAAERNRKVA